MKTISRSRARTVRGTASADAKLKRKRELRGRDRAVQFAVGILVVAVLVCYWNSLENGFVFDDEFLVNTFGRPQDFSHLLRILSDSYRPIRNASYVIDFLLWGRRPFGFHLTNVLIHTGNTLLVFFLIRRFPVRPVVPLVAALIFAVHPIQTDSVTYVSGRRDVLFTLFYLAAFHFYLRYRDKGSRGPFVLFLLSWACSLMSKEMAVSLPLVIFVWNFCELWGDGQVSWPRQFLSTAR